MRVGLGHLGLTPSVFWGMTLTEWFMAVEGYREKTSGGRDVEPLEKAGLEDLMKRFPDNARDTDRETTGIHSG